MVERERRGPNDGSGWIFLVGVCVALAAGVGAFLFTIEFPRRTRIKAVERIEAVGGTVETVSSCPEWLKETWVEDYFTYVVAVEMDCHRLSRSDASILSSLSDLDRLVLTGMNGGDGLGSRVLDSLPFSPDLYELRLYGVALDAIPPPEKVPNLTDLVVHSPTWVGSSPERIREVEDHRALERLTLWTQNDTVVRELIAAAGDLPSLEELRLPGCPVEDPFLVPLRRAPRLVVLDLSCTGVTPTGIRHIGEIQTLRHLELDNHGSGRKNFVDDTAMASIGRLKDLRFLQLDFTNVGDAGARHIGGLPELRYLYVQQTFVGTEGVKEIANCTKLERMNLEKSWEPQAVLDDEAVPALSTLANLEVVSLRGTDVTTAGLGRLRHALPKATVHPNRGRGRPSRAKLRLDAEKQAAQPMENQP